MTFRSEILRGLRLSVSACAGLLLVVVLYRAAGPATPAEPQVHEEEGQPIPVENLEWTPSPAAAPGVPPPPPLAPKPVRPRVPKPVKIMIAQKAPDPVTFPGVIINPKPAVAAFVEPNP